MPTPCKPLISIWRVSNFPLPTPSKTLISIWRVTESEHRLHPVCKKSTLWRVLDKITLWKDLLPCFRATVGRGIGGSHRSSHYSQTKLHDGNRDGTSLQCPICLGSRVLRDAPERQHNPTPQNHKRLKAWGPTAIDKDRLLIETRQASEIL